MHRNIPPIDAPFRLVDKGKIEELEYRIKRLEEIIDEFFLTEDYLEDSDLDD